jgi:hypothetical protein
MSEIPLELLNEMTPAVRAFVEALCARIREQDQIIATQQKRIEELERRLGMNSGNSSLPPSSDRPGQQPVSTAKPKSNRKRGGQAGHVKRTRSLIPTEACDRVVHHRPGACSDCGAKLRGDDPNPKRHQITDLPPGYNDIVADVRDSAALHIDETGWRQNGNKAWLWTVVGKLATLFAVRPSRSRNEVHHLLGDDFNGIVVCDRYSAYNHLADDCRQFCWAHLLRDFQAMIDRGGVSAEIGTTLKEYGQELIHHWNRLESKSIFVFVHHEGVSPTNNAAEQALRKSVIFRKLSFGTEQKTGSQNLAVIMSVTETCRRVGRRPFDYITDAVKAAFNTRPAPKLIPQN